MAEELPLVYVVFCPRGDSGPWWLKALRWFSDSDLAHVFIMTEVDTEQWLLLDCNDTGLQVMILCNEKKPDLIGSYRRLGCRVLRTQARIDGGYYFGGLISCVSVAKMALGIRSAWTITARQLFRWLLGNGAVEVYDGIGIQST